eukprot:6208593-Pleurochrysis_carterae.AAC.2
MSTKKKEFDVNEYMQGERDAQQALVDADKNEAREIRQEYILIAVIAILAVVSLIGLSIFAKYIHNKQKLRRATLLHMIQKPGNSRKNSNKKPAAAKNNNRKKAAATKINSNVE